ncbi:MAG: hypothetical protein A3J06_00405 [Candidatus Moranbacteria bacterium RIFCSPLOWO2_02_FULL_48_19]|nr:MAG: hypothetical protein A3J06_00405 [Candidatus Moranbacteria bacterium RIFCSPLOWO2_02_FULL_48_19]OGI30761.1 MAG: hypothetical protein A3G09_01765 [Candidatus Moranbacteria bacterium RIFCSPLOWO2_12_FULL_48_12]
MQFQELLEYIQFLNKFTAIKRTVKVSEEDRLESDSEHSYQLALVGWYVSEKLGLDLKKDLILKYALVHDLVEVYAGDTDPYNHSQDFIASQKEREEGALEKIKKKLPDFQSLHEAIEKYESLTDKEAKFVYLLDKILPVINTYLSKDAYYFKSGVSYERWKKHLDTKRLKVDFDEKSFQDLLEQIISFFRSVDKNFFKE